MFSLFKKREITDISGKDVYLRRWSLWLPFRLGLKLHEIRRTDDDRCQHDHPWGFWTLILWGGYDELVGEESKVNQMRPGMLRYRAPNFRHRIVALPKGKAWTLVLTTGRSREWGFYTREGWMHWRKFVDAARSSRVLWCHDGDAPLRPLTKVPSERIKHERGEN